MSWNYFWFFEAGGHGKPGAIFHPRQKGSNGGNFSLPDADIEYLFLLY